MTFTAAFSFQRHYRPDTPAVFFPDAQRTAATYAEFDNATGGAVERLAGLGIARGDVVALDVSGEFLHALLLVACARMGVATLSGSPAAVQEHILVKAVLRDGARAQEAASCPVITVDESWARLPAKWTGAPALEENHPDALCRIMLTSGSTGTPKGIALTYRMVQDRIDALLYAFGSDFPNCSRLLSGMQLSSSLGFVFLFHALARGGFYCADSRDFDKIIHAVEAHRVQAIVSTPFTLAEIVAHCAETGRTFPRLGLALTAGSLASRELLRGVRKLIAERVVVFYGTTETGVVASCWDDLPTGNVGLPVPGRCVDIVGPGGELLPLGESGTVRVRAAAGPLPFHDLPGWRERISREWFCPGDLGAFGPDGHLIIHGRHDNVINIGGTKTTPEALEQTLSAAPGVRDCGVVCRPDEFGIDRVHAFLVLGPGWDQTAFQAYCEARILRDFLPTRFVLVQQIPRNRNGKIDRPALATLIR